jgi:mRNA-degrading endonuclease toxin of MazEF toxin-antitoxin module
MVVPLTGSVEKDLVTHIRLSPGETGLNPSCAKCEDITTVFKDALIEPKQQLPTLSHARICQIAERVLIAMGCPRL